jgi:hypothetical protein
MKLAICLTEPKAALATLRLWSQRMKINQHLVGIARHSSRGIFLTDRCSGAFLIHVVRAALLAVVLAVVVVLVTG